MINKNMKLVTALVLALFIGVMGLGDVSALAADATVRTTTVNIHKIETDAEAKGTKYDLGTGITVGSDTWNQAFGTGAKGLSGVVFEVYKINTEANYNSLTLSDNTKALVEEKGGTLAYTTGATDANGLTTTKALEDGYYWIIEQPLATIKSSAAVPFGLELPYTNTDGSGYFETINVYPKNTLQDGPPVTKTIEESAASQHIGQPFDWTVSSVIPVGIKEYTKYEFIDVIDEKLDYISAVLVSPTDLTTADYTINYNGTTRTLAIALNQSGINKLTAGQTLSFKITTKINANAVMGDPIYNNVDLNFKNPHTEDTAKVPDPPTVVTGGKKFVKVNESSGGLQGAEFVVRNAAGQYLNITDGVRSFGEKANARKFTSDDDGTFEVTGLAYGSYVLEEIKAPEGYALPTDPDNNFTVGKDSYGDNAKLQIVNKAITIPQTGGMGTLLFTVAGVALMGTAVGFYKQSKKED